MLEIVYAPRIYDCNVFKTMIEHEMFISDITTRTKTSKKNLRKYLATDKPPTGLYPKV